MGKGLLAVTPILAFLLGGGILRPAQDERGNHLHSDRPRSRFPPSRERRGGGAGIFILPDFFGLFRAFLFGRGCSLRLVGSGGKKFPPFSTISGHFRDAALGQAQEERYHLFHVLTFPRRGSRLRGNDEVGIWEILFYRTFSGIFVWAGLLANIGWWWWKKFPPFSAVSGHFRDAALRQAQEERWAAPPSSFLCWTVLDSSLRSE